MPHHRKIKLPILSVLLGPEIQELIHSKDWRTLKDVLTDWPFADIADLIQSLKEEDQPVLFRLLPKPLAAEAFSEMDLEHQLTLTRQLGSDHLRDMVSELSPDDRTELFEDLPGSVTHQLLNILPSPVRKETLRLLGYPEESVGRMMTPEYIAIHAGWTVAKTLEHIRAHGHDAETINRVYVVDEKLVLIDDLSLRKIILAEPREIISNLMDHNFIAVGAMEDREKAVELIKKYNLYALPVIDSENILLGIVTSDDIFDILEDETTEDIHKSVSVAPLEQSYSASSFWILYRKRIVWLGFLTLAGLFSATVIRSFEEVLTAFMALAYFMPILANNGGNTGSQSAVLIIRALTIGEISLEKWFSVIRKEIMVGILLGLTLGGLLCVIGYVWQGSIHIGIVIGIAMSIIVLWANLVGSILPFLLIKLRFDPAVASGPLITTLIDATGLLIYFAVATFWMSSVSN